MRSFYILLTLTSLLFSSCLVLHSGQVSSGPVFDKTDKYVALGVGRAKSVFVFGFGNLGREDLVMKAKNNMLLSRPLSRGEYYANFTTSITNKFILFFIHNTKVTVSADVLRSQETTGEMYSENFKKQITPAAKKSQPAPEEENNIFTGDSVYYTANTQDYNLFKAVSVDKDNVMLKAFEGNGQNALVPVKSGFFVKNRALNGFKNGDVVVFMYEDDEVFPKPMDGTVMGVSDKKVLIKSEKGFFVLSPGKLKKK